MEKEIFMINRNNLLKKYSGMYISFVNGKMVAVDKNMSVTFKEAKEKFPDKEVSISYIPIKEDLVSLL